MPTGKVRYDNLKAAVARVLGFARARPRGCSADLTAIQDSTWPPIWNWKSDGRQPGSG
ncbi:hypothetical protein [Nonomuraea africana]|uniref:hypothetical protein n=1 Tax=Nonomuraea africana TaxID=46171 RepID=UPI0033C22E40